MMKSMVGKMKVFTVSNRYTITVYKYTARVGIVDARFSDEEQLILTYEEMEKTLALSEFMGDTIRLNADTAAAAYIPGVVITQSFKDYIRLVVIKKEVLEKICLEIGLNVNLSYLKSSLKQ